MRIFRNQPQGFRFSLAELMVVIAAVAVVCRWPITLSLAIPAGAHYLAGKISDPTDTRGLRRYSNRVILPVCWLLAAWTSWHHPGDEYGMFIVSALPGTWIAPFIFTSDMNMMVAPLFVAGIATMFLFGWSMDRLRVRPVLWMPLYVFGTIALVYWFLSQYPSYQRAMSKNGSLTAYISSAANLSLYLSALASLLVTAMIQCMRLVRHRHRRQAAKVPQSSCHDEAKLLR